MWAAHRQLIVFGSLKKPNEHLATAGEIAIFRWVTLVLFVIFASTHPNSISVTIACRKLCFLSRFPAKYTICTVQRKDAHVQTPCKFRCVLALLKALRTIQVSHFANSYPGSYPISPPGTGTTSEGSRSLEYTHNSVYSDIRPIILMREENTGGKCHF